MDDRNVQKINKGVNATALWQRSQYSNGYGLDD
jgi:hypothetical protein